MATLQNLLELNQPALAAFYAHIEMCIRDSDYIIASKIRIHGCESVQHLNYITTTGNG